MLCFELPKKVNISFTIYYTKTFCFDSGLQRCLSTNPPRIVIHQSEYPTRDISDVALL